MARENPTRTPTGILTFLGGLVLLVIFAALVVSWVRSNGGTDELTAKRAEGRKAARAQLEVKYKEQLETVGWVDKSKGVAHIPIADAMKLAVAELKAKKAGPSTVKVEAPLPVIAPDPNSTEPAPLALPSAPGGAQTTHFEAFPAAAPAAAMTPEAPAPATAVPAADTPPPAAPPRPPSASPAAATDPTSANAPTPSAPPPAPTPATPAQPVVPSAPNPQPVPAHPPGELTTKGEVVNPNPSTAAPAGNPQTAPNPGTTPATGTSPEAAPAAPAAPNPQPAPAPAP